MADESPYLVMVWSTGGYTLEARSGTVPQVGDRLKVGAHEHELIVTKISSSPLPGDWRRCVFTVAHPSLSA